MFSEVGQKQPVFGPGVRALVRLLTLGVLVAAGGALWLALSPTPWTWMAERLVRDLPGQVSIAGMDLIGPGELWQPATWELTVEGLEWVPDDPERPAFSVDRASAPLPDLDAWQHRREVHVDWLRIVGLSLHVPTQRPPPPWTPTDDPLALAADRVEIWHTRLQVDEDGPLSGLTASEITGQVDNLRFQPGTRDFSGLGHARIGPLVYGDLAFSQATIDEIVADDRGVVLGGVGFGLASGEGTATLRFEGLLKTQATLTLDTEVTSLRIQDIVAATSDRPSPVRGLVSATGMMQTDPQAERGTSVLTAQVRVPTLVIPLDLQSGTVSPLLRGVLELFGYRPGGGLRLKSLYGPIQLGRGWVSIDGLRSTVLGVAIELRARIDEGQTWILVRRLPRLRNLGALSRATGAVGLVIEGTDDDLYLRIADEAEMKAGRQVGPLRRDGVRLGD